VAKSPQRTKQELIDEVTQLRARVAELERSNGDPVRARQLNRLQLEVGTILSRAVGLDQALSLTIEAVCQIDGIDFGGIYLIDPHDGALQLTAQCALPPEVAQQARHYSAGSAQASLVRVGQPVYAAYQELGIALSRAEPQTPRGVIAWLPIQHHQQSVAALQVAALSLDEFPADVRRTLEWVADQLGGVIGRLSIEEALRQSQKYLQILFDALEDFLFVIDDQFRIVWVNLVVVKRLGYSEEELLDQPVVNVHPPDRRAEASALLAEIVAGHGDACSVPLMTKGGELIPAETKFAQGRWGAREILFGVSRDVTQRLQAEEALRRYAQELQSRNEELDAFAQTVAHDLKNPLGLIGGYAELLERDSKTLADPNLRESLEAIERNARKMENIIDELLLLSEARKIEVDLKPLDMAHIVGEARQRLAYMIEEHQTDIELPEAWPQVLGYAPWVEEIWVNYLSNALKYGGQPPKIQLGADLPKDGMVRFWVRDNGRGLTVEEQARLFTPFERLNQARARGHGLGLSIVRRIVEKLGGVAGVESTLGQGSLFSFTLPAAK
jgi:PAS domain S-box-containing protein